MNGKFKAISKKTLSGILALAIILCSITVVFSAFANNEAVEAPYTVSYRSPAIPMFAGKVVDFADLEVDFSAAEGDTVNGADITWSVAEGDNTILLGKSIYAQTAGTTKLIATYGALEQAVYVIANENQDDYDFYLVNQDYHNDYTQFKESEWLFAAGGIDPNTTNWYNKSYPSDNKGAIAGTYWGFQYPSERKPYFEFYYSNDVGIMFYKSEILKDFADYTFSATLLNNTDYAAGASRGFVFRADIDYNAPIYSTEEGATNTSVFNTTGLYLGQHRYGAVYAGSFGKEYMSAIGNYHGMPVATFHSLDGDNYKKFINATDDPYTSASNEAAAAGGAYPVDPNYVLSMMKAGYDNVKTVTVKLDGEDILYKIGDNTLLDTTKQVYLLTDYIKNSTAVNTEYDWDTNFAEKGTTGKGTIGFHSKQGMSHIYGFSVKLNDVNADTMPNLKDPSFYTVKASAPAIPMYAGKVVDFSDVVVEFGDEIVSADKATWAVASGSAIIVNGGVYAKEKGITKLTATYGGNTQNVYVIANEIGDTNFVLASETGLNNTATFDASKWIMAYGEGTSPAETTLYYNAAGVPNLKLGNLYGGDTRVFFYRNDMLNDFADYTVAMSMKISGENATKPFRGVILRAQLNPDAFNADGSIKDEAAGTFETSGNLTTAGAMGIVKPGTSAIYLTSTNFGGLNVRGYYAKIGSESYPFFNETNRIRWDTVANPNDIKIVNRNPNMVLSTYSDSAITAVTGFRNVVYKVNGNDIFYSIDGNEILDTTKANINAMDVNTGYDNVLGENWNVEGKMPEGGDFDHPFVDVTDKTHAEANQYVENFGTTKGTIGITAATRTGLEVASLTVSLNGVASEKDLPAMYDPNFYVANAENPIIPMTAGTRLAISSFLVEFDGKVVVADTLTWEEIDNENIKVKDGYITAFERGAYTVNVTNGEKSTKFYVVVKNSDETEYVIYDKDFRDKSTDVSDWKTVIYIGDPQRGAVTEYNSTNYPGAVEYTGNNMAGNLAFFTSRSSSKTTIEPNGFAPFVPKEVNTTIGANVITSFTTLDNDMVKSLSNYKVTAAVKAFPNARGAIGFVGRVTTDANGKYVIGSETHTGFGLQIGNGGNYWMGGHPYVNGKAFVIKGHNLKTAVASQGVENYLHKYVTGTDFQHRVFEMNYSGDVVTYTAPNGATETVSGINAANGTVALVSYNNDVIGSTYLGVPILASVKITLTNVDASALVAEKIDYTPTAPSKTEAYKDLQNYAFTATDGVIDGYSITSGEKLSQKVTFPSTIGESAITKIGKKLFQNSNTGISEIVIPEGYTAILDYAFEYNYFLDTVTIPTTLKSVNQNALKGTGIVEFIVPEGSQLETISYSALNTCKSLIKVDLGDNVKYIYNDAFAGCSALESIVLPASVEVIANAAFSNATALEDIYIYSKDAAIEVDAYNADKPNAVTIPQCATIHAYIGSTAHAYALKYGNKFVPLDELSVNASTEIAAVEGFTVNAAVAEAGAILDGTAYGFKQGTLTVSGSYSYVATEGADPTVLPFSIDLKVGAFDKDANNFINTDKIVVSYVAGTELKLTVADDVNLKHDEFKINGNVAYLPEADESGKAYLLDISDYAEGVVITAEFEADADYLTAIYGLGATVPVDTNDLAIRFVNRIPAIANTAFRSSITVGGENVTPVAVGSMVIPTVLVNSTDDIKLSDDDIAAIVAGEEVVEVAVGAFNASNVVISILNDTTADYSDYVVRLSGIENVEAEITCVSYIIYQNADGSFGVIYDGVLARSYSAINAALR